MSKLRHWFWHIIALLTVTDWWNGSVGEDEWEAYKAFMVKHGYNKPGEIVP